MSNEAGIAKWRAVADQYKEVQRLVDHYHAAGDIDHVISVEPSVEDKLAALRDSIEGDTRMTTQTIDQSEIKQVVHDRTHLAKQLASLRASHAEEQKGYTTALAAPPQAFSQSTVDQHRREMETLQRRVTALEERDNALAELLPTEEEQAKAINDHDAKLRELAKLGKERAELHKEVLRTIQYAVEEGTKFHGVNRRMLILAGEIKRLEEGFQLDRTETTHETPPTERARLQALLLQHCLVAVPDGELPAGLLGEIKAAT